MKWNLTPIDLFFRTLAVIAAVVIGMSVIHGHGLAGDASDDDGTDDFAIPVTPNFPAWEIICPGEAWGAVCIQHNTMTGEVRYVAAPERP